MGEVFGDAVDGVADERFLRRRGAAPEFRRREVEGWLEHEVTVFEGVVLAAGLDPLLGAVRRRRPAMS